MSALGSAPRRTPPWLWVVLGAMGVVVAVLLVWLLAGGAGDDGGPTSGPTSASSPSATATPSPSGTSVSDATRDLTTISGVGTEVRRAVVSEYGAGAWSCPPDRPVGYGSAFSCTFVPDEPLEFGPVQIVVLDDRGHYAYAVGGCCDAVTLEAYSPGLLCRDLTSDPRGEFFEGMPGLSYTEALYYWYLEGRPSRMDVGGDGVPCTTVYPAAEVAATWSEYSPPADPVVESLPEVADVLPALRSELVASYGEGQLLTRDAGLVVPGTRFTAWIQEAESPYAMHFVEVSMGTGTTFTWRETDS